MPKITRTIKVTETVSSNVETHVLPSGSQARVVTRNAKGQFINVTPLTPVNPR